MKKTRVIPRLAERAEGPHSRSLRYPKNVRPVPTKTHSSSRKRLDRLRGPSPSARLGMTRLFMYYLP
jgi:hypothetical protein